MANRASVNLTSYGVVGSVAESPHLALIQASSRKTIQLFTGRSLSHLSHPESSQRKGTERGGSTDDGTTKTQR